MASRICLVNLAITSIFVHLFWYIIGIVLSWIFSLRPFVILCGWVILIVRKKLLFLSNYVVIQLKWVGLELKTLKLLTWLLLAKFFRVSLPMMLLFSKIFSISIWLNYKKGINVMWVPPFSLICVLLVKFMQHCWWIMGKGDRIHFWHDNWIDSPILNLILNSFIISNPWLMVSDCLSANQHLDIDYGLSLACPQLVNQI